MAEITDPKLLARIRKLVRGECSGYCTEQNEEAHYCVEPESSHFEETCGYFRETPCRCLFFEDDVLPRADSKLYDSKPLDPGLGEVYQQHLKSGAEVQVRRCEWTYSSGARCKKEIASLSPHAKYCEHHSRQAELARKKAWAEKARNGSRVDVLEKIAPAEG